MVYGTSSILINAFCWRDQRGNSDSVFYGNRCIQSNANHVYGWQSGSLYKSDD